MERSARRRRERERGGEDHAAQANRDFDQSSDRGAAGLSGHLSAGSAQSDPEHQRAAADGEPAGRGAAPGQPAASGGHRQQR